MPRNIIIFSDGTGQASNLRRTNGSATSTRSTARRAADRTPTSIAAEQSLFTSRSRLAAAPWRVLRHAGLAVAAQSSSARRRGSASPPTSSTATPGSCGCDEPGDRIYLFGFSRGAYTVRCLAAVLSLCGVPTRCRTGDTGALVMRDRTTIAKEAVKKVYQLVSSPKDTAYVEQRKALAAQLSAEVRLATTMARPTPTRSSSACSIPSRRWEATAVGGAGRRRHRGRSPP